MRCYNGCPDSDLQKLLDKKNQDLKDLKQLGVSVTYFPMEGKYMGFKDIEPITKFHTTIGEIHSEIIGKLLKEPDVDGLSRDKDGKLVIFQMKVIL